MIPSENCSSLPLSLFVSFAVRPRSSMRSANPADGPTPFPPFRIAGNLYYVGSEDLAVVSHRHAARATSSSTAISQSSPPLIQKSVESLGFQFSDIKILLISHAHYDHCAGSAEIQATDRREVRGDGCGCVRGRVRRPHRLSTTRADKIDVVPAAHVDRILHDGDTVSLGGTVLTAHLTAGHTKGTTTWTMDEHEGGRTLHVVIVGSPNVNPGYKLVGNKTYPQIADDYRRQFEVLKSLPCDVFLGAHGGYFDLKEKYARFKSRRQQRLHRSRRIQGLHRRSRAGV